VEVSRFAVVQTPRTGVVVPPVDGSTACICPGGTVEGLQVPTAPCGTTVVLPCPGQGTTGLVSVACSATGQFGAPDTRNCVQQAFLALQGVVLDGDNVLAVMEVVEDTAADNSVVFGTSDIVFATDSCLDSLRVVGSNVFEDLLRLLVSIVGNLLRSQQLAVRDGTAQLTNSTAAAAVPRVRDAFCLLRAGVLARWQQLWWWPDGLGCAQGMAFLGALFSELLDALGEASDSEAVAGFRALATHLDQNERRVSFGSDPACPDLGCTPAGDDVPDGQFVTLLFDEGSAGAQDFSVFIYANARLFVEDGVESISGNSSSLPEGPFINSAVIEGQVTSSGVTFVGKVRVRLRLLQTGVTGRIQSCAFWAFDEAVDANSAEASLNAKRSRGRWSTQGCQVVASETSGDSVVCECDHLTNFAVLTSGPQAKSRNRFALEVITYIGVAISVPALLATFFIFLFYRSLRSLSKIILMHLCVCLVVALLLLVFGVDATEDQSSCTAIAVSLHYFLLAAFFWMLAEGVSAAPWQDEGGGAMERWNGKGGTEELWGKGMDAPAWGVMVCGCGMGEGQACSSTVRLWSFLIRRTPSCTRVLRWPSTPPQR
jgi:hypothetical protein